MGDYRRRGRVGSSRHCGCSPAVLVGWEGTGVLKVAAYTGGENVPSARFRVRQYIPALRELQVDLREFSARWGMYPPARKALRPFWATATLGERAAAATRSFGASVTLLQREMISTFL